MNDYRRRPGAVRVFGTSLEASFVEALERASLAFGAPRPEAAEGVARDTKEGERRAAPLILLEIEDAERLISFLESDAASGVSGGPRPRLLVFAPDVLEGDALRAFSALEDAGERRLFGIALIMKRTASAPELAALLAAPGPAERLWPAIAERTDGSFVRATGSVLRVDASAWSRRAAGVLSRSLVRERRAVSSDAEEPTAREEILEALRAAIESGGFEGFRSVLMGDLDLLAGPIPRLARLEDLSDGLAPLLGGEERQPSAPTRVEDPARSTGRRREGGTMARTDAREILAGIGIAVTAVALLAFGVIAAASALALVGFVLVLLGLAVAIGVPRYRRSRARRRRRLERIRASRAARERSRVEQERPRWDSLVASGSDPLPVWLVEAHARVASTVEALTASASTSERAALAVLTTAPAVALDRAIRAELEDLVPGVDRAILEESLAATNEAELRARVTRRIQEEAERAVRGVLSGELDSAQDSIRAALAGVLPEELEEDGASRFFFYGGLMAARARTPEERLETAPTGAWCIAIAPAQSASGSSRSSDANERSPSLIDF